MNKLGRLLYVDLYAPTPEARALKQEIQSMDLDKLTVLELYFGNSLKRFEKLQDGRWYLWQHKMIYTTKTLRIIIKHSPIKAVGLVM